MKVCFCTLPMYNPDACKYCSNVDYSKINSIDNLKFPYLSELNCDKLKPIKLNQWDIDGGDTDC